MMTNYDASLKAGNYLSCLIQDNYATQGEFALDFGAELRTVSRWINQGIHKVETIQELAAFFEVDFLDFFRNSKKAYYKK